MPRSKKDEWPGIVREAIAVFDARIAELESTRAGLASLIEGVSAEGAKMTAAGRPRKRRKVSAATRAKQKAAAKARWARERGAKAKKQAPVSARKSSRKARSAKAGPSKATAKKGG